MIRLLLLLLLTLGMACSSKEKAFRETDTAPVIGLGFDTLFVREKDPLNIHGNGVFMFQASPAHHQLHLQLLDTSGVIHFSYRGQPLQNQQPVIVAGEWNTLFCRVDQAGVYSVDLSLRDQLGRVTHRPLVIKAAAAQRPMAALSWRQDHRDPVARRYYFDAGGSRQPFGRLVSYHFLIGQQAVQSASDQLTYVFHQPGSYPVSLYVVDDLGQHSDTVHQTLVVL